MIAAFLDDGRSAAERFLFRGRDLGFWIERSFPFCRFLDKPGRGKGDEFILVFAHDRFPAICDTGRSELRRILQTKAPAAGGAFTSVGKPFFAVSRSFLRKNGIGLVPGIFRKLCAIPGIEELKSKLPATPIDPRREPLAVETAVVALQIRHMQKQGVRFDDFGNFYMEGLPAIGRGSLIGPGVVIRGDSNIGRNATLMANCFIENSTIGDNCVILPGSLILDSRIEKNVRLGPYCHVRLGSLIRQRAKIGNFVEIKKSVLGRGSKAMHLSYIGDAAVGCKTNIGAGTITCNYDGAKKSPTFIGDNVFIGSGTELVAPVRIESDSYVGAGSTITEDVPHHALALARQRQRNIAGWVLRKRKK